MSKRKSHPHYIIFAFATVLFWRGVWHFLDRFPIMTTLGSDVGSIIIGTILLWWLSKGFRHLH